MFSLLLVALLYALCGLSFTVSKIGLYTAAPLFFVAIRMLIAGALLLAIFYISGNKKKIIDSFDYSSLMQLVLFHIFLAYTCDAWALTRMSSIESAFIYDFSPFVTAFFSYFFNKERLKLEQVLGISLSFCALIFFLFSGNSLSCSASSSLSARVITFVAVISSAYGWVLMRSIMQKGYSILFLNGLSMFFGGSLALCASALSEGWQQGIPVTDYPSFILTLFLLILIMNGAFYNLYGYLLTKYSATFLSFAGFTCPFFAHLFGCLFLGEPFCYELLLATGIVTIGLFLFYRAEFAQERP